MPDNIETFPPLTDDELENAKKTLSALGKKTGFTSHLLWRALDELCERRRIEAGEHASYGDRQLELPETYHDRGHRYERTQCDTGDLEKAFADAWEAENKRVSYINFGQGLLQDLFIERTNSFWYKWIAVITARDRFIAATVIQWLGTNCGFCFLTKCLNKVGYKVNECDEILNTRHLKYLDSRRRALREQRFQMNVALVELIDDLEQDLRKLKFEALMRHPREERL